MLTEREYKKIFLSETQHFPEFLVPIFKSTTQYLDAIIASMIKSNIEKYITPFYLTTNEYLDSIIFDIELFGTNDVTDLRQYNAEYFGNYLNPIEKRFQYITLKIKCPYNGNDFGLPFLNSVVYHELEHMFDDYICQKNGGSAMIDDLKNIQSYDFFEYMINNYSNNRFLLAIAKVCYFCQIDEIKTFSTQAYKELEDSNCNRENYHEAIKQISSYKQYKDIQDKQLEFIKISTDNDIKMLISIYKKFPKLIIPQKQNKAANS